MTNHRSNITSHLNDEIDKTKNFFGNTEETYLEAENFLKTEIKSYIKEKEIKDLEETFDIYLNSNYTIEEEDNLQMLFVVCKKTEIGREYIGSYFSIEDAEAAIEEKISDMMTLSSSIIDRIEKKILNTVTLNTVTLNKSIIDRKLLRKNISKNFEIYVIPIVSKIPFSYL